ncbi:hypothetical protein RMSM_07112 [Rhodopirellula maiorica SM1]|uniref:Uncharacterized protein n=1 Tax=Rhodopirellula maiorica SM1 TaxID=1265738 RepID=M5RKR3_9BACT|nr:hypothetical protein [Rhodopirellula maiorica]EMI15957.1 hypothetical protein RMSM_07112 [Rhodopirellula maiorica SM1]
MDGITGNRLDVATSSMTLFRRVLTMIAVAGSLLPSLAIGGEGMLEFDAPAADRPLNNFDKLDLPGPHRYEPLFGVDVGGLALKRSGPDAFPLLYTDSSELVETSDAIDPEIKLGTRISVTLFNLTRYAPGVDFDFVFLSVDDMVAETQFDASNYTTTNLNPLFYGGSPVSPDPSYTMFLDSDLDSAEWMIGYRPIQRIRLSAGLRWIRLDETFDVIDTASLATSTRLGFFSTASNEAFGFQIGGEATLWTNGRSRIYARGKYAALNNEVQGSAVALNTSFTYEGEKDTSLVDVEIGGAMWLCSWASLQLAYQGLWLEDAVGALEQSSSQSFFDASTQTPAYHDLNWNGLNFGFSMVW